MRKLTHIRVFSHGLSVKPADGRGKHILMQFALKTAQWEYRKTPPTWRVQKKISRVFAGATKSRSEYRFHKNQLDELLRHLDANGIGKSQCKIEYMSLPKSKKIDYGFKLPNPRDYQVKLIKHLSRTDLPTKVTNLQTGKGKASPLSSMVKIPGGWIRMGDIEVGQVVTAKDGTACSVIGVYPQGLEPVYTVTFADGRSTKVSADHLWSVRCSDSEKDIIINTEELKHRLALNGVLTTIPLCDSEKIPDVEYETPISELPIHELDAVPTEYLHGSTSQRTELLSLLIDAPISTCNDVMFVTDKEQLALDVVYLARSLGGWAIIHRAVLDDGTILCSVNMSLHVSGDWLTRERLVVVDMDYAGEEETQCIEIDHPDKLYVTDDFIVTHNTFCGLSAINKIGKRALLQLRGGYVERWLTDIKEFMTPGKNELMVIRGSGPLKSAINAARMGEFPEETKLVILTTGTLHSFLKEYETNGKNNAFEIEPHELYSLLGIGVVLIDESHEGYHLNYRSDIYRNVESVIHLSATLETEDRFRRMIYDILYPANSWAPEVEYDAYIDVTAVKYHVKTPKRYPTTRRGSDMYSHAAFEEIFLRCDRTFTIYMTIILDRIMEQYIKTHQPGQKMLLFFSLTELCDKAAKWLKTKLTDLDICVFISGCSEELFLKNDIIVTTIESCGTARDIPDLVYALLTRNVMRLEANEQIKGRLRKIKRWPEMSPKFDYLVCMGIPKHMEYHEAKRKQFEGKVASHTEFISGYQLP